MIMFKNKIFKEKVVGASEEEYLGCTFYNEVEVVSRRVSFDNCSFRGGTLIKSRGWPDLCRFTNCSFEGERLCSENFQADVHACHTNIFKLTTRLNVFGGKPIVHIGPNKKGLLLDILKKTRERLNREDLVNIHFVVHSSSINERMDLYECSLLDFGELTIV